MKSRLRSLNWASVLRATFILDDRLREHPLRIRSFAVSDDKGNFTIKGDLPDGGYTLRFTTRRVAR